MVVVLLAFGLVDVLLSLPSEVLGLTIVSGIIGLGIGDTLYMVGLKSVGVSRAVPLAATYPLFSLLWSVLLLGQAVSYTAVVGAGAILVGIWLLTRQKNQDSINGNAPSYDIGIVASFSDGVGLVFEYDLDGCRSHGANVSSLAANYAIITVRMVLWLCFCRVGAVCRQSSAASSN